jgi:hypothetical protein
VEDGRRLAPMAAELADRLAISVAIRRFPSMGVTDSRSLPRSDIYVCLYATFRLSIYFDLLSTGFGGCAARIHATSFYDAS